jgi:hypothetical protein
MRRWWKNHHLHSVDLDELSEIAGNEWTTFWGKLEIKPAVNGGVVIGELSIKGKPARPIITCVGFSSRGDVIEALCDLGLTKNEAEVFLRCQHDREYVMARLEEQMLSADEED